MNRVLKLMVCLGMVLLLPTVSFAAEKKSPLVGFKTSKNAPTRIVSDMMMYNEKEMKVVFLGKVYVKHDTLELWTDKMLVLLHPAAPSSDSKKTAGKKDVMNSVSVGEIKELQAIGNVRMKSEERTGSCGLAKYDVDTGLLTMTENPQLKEPGRSLTGTEIRYYSNEGKSEVIGTEKQRVEVYFQGPIVNSPAGKVKKPKVLTGN